MARENTDGLYIELGYFTPEEYYTYIANAYSGLSSDFNLSATGTKIGVTHQGASSLTVTATQSATAGRTRQFTTNFDSAFTPTMTASAIKNSFAILDTASTMSTTGTVTRTTSVNFDTQATTSIAATGNKTFDATLSTTSSISAPFYRAARTTPIVVNSGDIYTTVEISDTQSKFGGKSLLITSSDKDDASMPTGYPLWDGTNFVTIRFDNNETWTSSNGTSWSSSSNNLSANLDRFKYANSTYYNNETGSTYYSTDATTWNTFSPSITNVTFSANEYFSGYWYYGGRRATTTTSDQFEIYRTSTLGTNPTYVAGLGAINELTSGTIRSLNVANNTLIAVYNISTAYYIAYSTNGTSWTSSVTTPALFSNNITYGNGNYVVQGGGYLYKSTNLSTWTQVSGIAVSGTTTIKYENSTWVVQDSNAVYAGSSIDSMSTSLDLTYINDVPSIQYLGGIAYNGTNWIIPVNERIYYSSNLSSWNYTVPTNASNVPGYAYYDIEDTNTQFGTIDFWYYHTTNNIAYIVSKKSSYEQAYITITNNRVNSTLNGSLSSPSNSLNSGWNHIRIVSDGSTNSLYLNGTREDTDTATTSTVDNLFFGGRENTYDVWIDEFLITDEVLNNPSDTSITVPTAEYSNTVDTDILLHFNNSFADDAPEIYRVGSASLTSDFALTAGIITYIGGAASLDTTATVSATADKIVGASAALNSAFTVTAEGIEPPEQAQADLTATFTTQADATRVANSAATVSANFTTSAVGGLIKDTSAAFASSLTLTAANTRTRTASASQSSEFTLSATPSQVYIAELLAFTNASLSLTGSLIRTTTSDIDAAFNQTTTANKINGTTSDLTSAFTSTVTPTRIRPFTIETDAIATQLTAAAKIGVTLVAMDTQASMTVTAKKTAADGATLDSYSSLAVDAQRLRGVDSTLTSTATFSSPANYLAGGVINMSALYAQLSTGKIVHIDPALTYRIAREIRVYNINEENRDYII